MERLQKLFFLHDNLKSSRETTLIDEIREDNYESSIYFCLLNCLNYSENKTQDSLKTKFQTDIYFCKHVWMIKGAAWLTEPRTAYQNLFVLHVINAQGPGRHLFQMTNLLWQCRPVKVRDERQWDTKSLSFDNEKKINKFNDNSWLSITKMAMILYRGNERRETRHCYFSFCGLHKLLNRIFVLDPMLRQLTFCRIIKQGAKSTGLKEVTLNLSGSTSWKTKASCSSNLRSIENLLHPPT